MYLYLLHLKGVPVSLVRSYVTGDKGSGGDVVLACIIKGERLSFEKWRSIQLEVIRAKKAAEFVRNKIGRRDCLRVISMKNRFRFYREGKV